MSIGQALYLVICNKLSRDLSVEYIEYSLQGMQIMLN